MSAGLALVLPGRSRPAAGAVGARSVPEIERRNQELEALYAAAVTMGSSSDLASTAEQTLDVVLGVAGSHVGMVYRLDVTREYLVLIAHRGLPPELVDRLRERRVDDSHIGEAVRT